MELIKLSLGDYPRYEELLLKRDRLQKEALQHNYDYLRIFGDIITEIFKLKIECIGLKKKISFLQMMINRGEEIDIGLLEDQIKAQMEEYYEQLRNMIEDNENSKKGKMISEHDIQKIKKIYHNIARQIHPDISPITEEYEELKDMWNRVVIAYKCNHLEELEELEFLINSFLENKGIGQKEIVIDNIDKKIDDLEKEISEILSTDPYRFKYLLADEEAVEGRMNDYEEELKEYQDYRDELEGLYRDLIEMG